MNQKGTRLVSHVIRVSNLGKLSLSSCDYQNCPEMYLSNDNLIRIIPICNEFFFLFLDVRHCRQLIFPSYNIAWKKENDLPSKGLQRRTPEVRSALSKVSVSCANGQSILGFINFKLYSVASGWVLRLSLSLFSLV